MALVFGLRQHPAMSSASPEVVLVFLRSGGGVGSGSRGKGLVKAVEGQRRKYTGRERKRNCRDVIRPFYICFGAHVNVKKKTLNIFTVKTSL